MTAFAKAGAAESLRIRRRARIRRAAGNDDTLRQGQHYATNVATPFDPAQG